MAPVETSVMELVAVSPISILAPADKVSPDLSEESSNSTLKECPLLTMVLAVLAS